MSFELDPATEPQLRYIGTLAKDAGMTLQERDELIRRVTAGRANEPLQLRKGDASRVIERLRRGDVSDLTVRG